MSLTLTRREFIRLTGIGVVAASRCAAGVRLPGAPGIATLFVGTYTNGRSEGIYRCRFESGTGTLGVESAVSGVLNPSFLGIDRERGRLFCVNETAEFEGKPAGSVSAFALEGTTGGMRLLNRRSTHGADPCHLTIDPAGRFVLVANYSGGNLAVLPVLDDGSLGEATDIVQHTGSSVKPRQQGPHVHSVVLDPAGRYAYAADLGLDRVMIYRFDNREGRLLSSASGWAGLKPGAGPRHLAFSPDGSRVYVVNELDSTLTLFAVDGSTGGLEARQTVSTAPSAFSGANFPADIHMSGSGRFVYCSNRGHDSIAVLAVDATTGEVSPVQHAPTGGRWPRNFTIDPAGQFLLVANQKSDTITVFAIDPVSGTLTLLGQPVEVPSPSCLKFL